MDATVLMSLKASIFTSLDAMYATCLEGADITQVIFPYIKTGFQRRISGRNWFDTRYGIFGSIPDMASRPHVLVKILEA